MNELLDTDGVLPVVLAQDAAMRIELHLSRLCAALREAPQAERAHIAAVCARRVLQTMLPESGPLPDGPPKSAGSP